MARTLKGVYRNGRVELFETPEGIEQADVVVTFSDTTIAATDEGSRDARRLDALKWLRETGWNLGGQPYPARDELHDRPSSR